MKIDRREWVAAMAPGAVLAVAGLGGLAGFAATLSADERAALAAMLEPRGALLLLGWLLLSGALGAALRAAYLRWVGSAARLAEQAGVVVATPTAPALEAPASAETRALADAINQLARQRDALRADVAAQVREASRGVEQERNRLAALMAELTQSVVVCNLDGRILLYNSRARTAVPRPVQRARAGRWRRAARPGPLDLRRARPRLVAHALESVQQRLARGAAHPSAQFVTTTRAGQLLRVQMAPVRDIDAGRDGAALAASC
jgi:DNA polymerase-3 subunit epsilon